MVQFREGGTERVKGLRGETRLHEVHGHLATPKE